MNANVMIDEQLRLLAATPMLSGVHHDSLIRLARASRFVVIPKGEFLFQQHDSADSLYILRSGELAIILSSIDGREMIIDEIHPGDCFGEVALLASGERTAGAQAREKSEVMEIKARPFLDVLDSDHVLARGMLSVATQRLFKAQKRESALAFLDAPARIARVLLQMDVDDKQGPDKGYITLSQEELAQRTGLSRQTVANNLGHWRRRDWLLTGRGRIMLLNRSALRRIEEQGLI